jgi:hypothetical protein
MRNVDGELAGEGFLCDGAMVGGIQRRRPLRIFSSVRFGEEADWNKNNPLYYLYL